ncbi:MAG: hydrogenase maturation protease [Desulfomonilia bacterium]
MKVLVLGMGNPILSDDGVGLIVAERLKGTIDGVQVETSPLIGLNLLDSIIGYDTLFIVDAMTTGGTIGRVRKLTSQDRHGTLHLFSSHGMDIFELMEFGSCSGLHMPKLGGIYGIEIGREVAFGEELSPVLTEQLDTIIETIRRDIERSLEPLNPEQEQA